MAVDAKYSRSPIWHQRIAITSLSVMLFATLLSPLHASEPEATALDQQRSRFLHAKKALEHGDRQQFFKTAATLKEYPLYPYLTYWQLLDNLGEQNSASITAFLEQHRDTPLATPLRVAWLKQLARKQRWQEYLNFYHGSNRSELRCYALRAQLHSGDKAAAWAGAEKLWLVGYSQNEACDPLFAAWAKAGGITDALRWRRIELAMERGNSALASYLVQPLDKQQQQWVELWKQVHRDPERIRNEKALRQDNARNRTLVLHGLIRIARRDAVAAAELWSSLAKRYHFSAAQRYRLQKSVAMNFAFDGDARALHWFSLLPGNRLTSTTAGWAVRTALRRGDWRNTLRWIGKLPSRKRLSDQWRYWQARAYEALDQKFEANAIYQDLSHSRTYYGFLAADRTGAEYNLDNTPLNISDEAVDALANKPALVRAHELFRLKLTREARREWDYAVAKMNKQQRLIAGKLADDWQWHDRALLTLARANHFDDLDIRFPLAHSETIEREASKHGLDPEWIYAVARQESAFIEDVRSSAGAMGLMQLMPGTGRTIARKLKTKLNLDELLKPETNIRFGSYYLQQVLSRFDSNPVLATAAYNAGPHHVEAWKPKQGTLDADIWIDTMPFYETRKYVRRVMAYTVFYDQRLQRPITRLRDRMPQVSTEREVIGCDNCTAKQGGKG